MYTKKKGRRIVLIACIQIVVCMMLYLFHPKGRAAYTALRREHERIELDNAALEDTIYLLERRIERWKQYNFYKEKIAREELQMARSTDKVYYLT